MLSHLLDTMFAWEATSVFCVLPAYHSRRLVSDDFEIHVKMLARDGAVERRTRQDVYIRTGC